MEPGELASWAKAINVEELRNYMIEVGQNTQCILSELTLEQITFSGEEHSLLARRLIAYPRRVKGIKQ